MPTYLEDLQWRIVWLYLLRGLNYWEISVGPQSSISILFAYVDHINCHNWRHWLKDETHLIRYAPICTGNGVQRVKQVHRPRRRKCLFETQAQWPDWMKMICMKHSGDEDHSHFWLKMQVSCKPFCPGKWCLSHRLAADVWFADSQEPFCKFTLSAHVSPSSLTQVVSSGQSVRDIITMVIWCSKLNCTCTCTYVL